MKKSILSIIFILSCIICNSQIKPPAQIDTLSVTEVQYNFVDIRKEYWPSLFICRSATMFSIGENKFEILDAQKNNFNSSILFTVTDYNEEYPLKYYVEHDGTIIIEFSGYIFKCRQDGGRHKSINEEEVFTFHEVEQKPKFMGLDINAFSNWVSDNLQYPEEMKKNRLSGRVTLQFTIDTEGNVTDVEVIQGASPEFDKEAIRVISSSPKWQPGMYGGKPVAVRITYPIIFTVR